MRSGESPLEVGARLSCRWRDGEHHPVRVIERRKRDPARGGGPLLGDPSDFEYYVHYEQCAFVFTRACLPCLRLLGLQVSCHGMHAWCAYRAWVALGRGTAAGVCGLRCVLTANAMRAVVRQSTGAWIPG
jgi:hypothetical protein